MIPLILQHWRPAVAALLAVAGFAGGYALKGRVSAAEIERLRGDIARIEAAHAAEKQAAAEAAARRLAAAEEAGRAAVLALHATRARLDARNRQLRETLYDLPTANHCGLSAGAVRLLDRAIGDAGALPEDTGGADREPAESAAAAARPAASEAAIGVWIAAAARLYEECRARIDAIKEWEELTYGR